MKLSILHEQDAQPTDEIISQLDEQGIGHAIKSKIRKFIDMVFSPEFTTQTVYEAYNLEELVNPLFATTEVKVYYYKSSNPRIFSLPDSKYFFTHGSPFHVRVSEVISKPSIGTAILWWIIGAFKSSFAITGFFLMPMMFKNMSNIIHQIPGTLVAITAERGNPWKITYDEKEHKISMNVQQINIFVTSGFLDLMESDDEFKAAALYSTGQTINFITRFLKSFLGLAAGSFGLFEFHATFKNSGIVNDPMKLYGNLITSLVVIFLIYKLLKFPLTIVGDSMAKDFVAKTGYGQELQDILKKMMDHDVSIDPPYQISWVERTLIKIGNLGKRCLGISGSNQPISSEDL